MALLLCRKLRGDEGIWNYSVTCFVGVMLPRTEPVTGYTAPGEWREYFCSNMAKSGMNPKTLQKIMGHSDIGVTLNAYTHLDFEDIEKEMKEVCSRQVVKLQKVV